MKKTIEELAWEYIQSIAGTDPNTDISLFEDDYNAFMAGANAVKNNVDLADVGGALPTQRDFLKTIIHWHEEYNEKGHFNIPLVHEQYEYLTWLSNRLAKVHGQ